MANQVSPPVDPSAWRRGEARRGEARRGEAGRKVVKRVPPCWCYEQREPLPPLFVYAADKAGAASVLEKNGVACVDWNRLTPASDQPHALVVLGGR